MSPTPPNAIDLAQREKDTQIGIELFRVVHGRLPNEKGDDITKKLAKTFLDMAHEGNIKPEYMYMMPFAFHV